MQREVRTRIGVGLVLAGLMLVVASDTTGHGLPLLALGAVVLCVGITMQAKGRKDRDDRMP